MFYIIAGFLVFGITFFGIFARGEVLDWAREEVDEEEGGEGEKEAEEMKMLGKEEDAANGHVAV